MHKLIPTALFLLMLAAAVPAARAEAADVDDVRRTLQELTRRLDAAAEPVMDPQLVSANSELRGVILRWRLTRIEQTVTEARLTAYEALLPLVGSIPLSTAGNTLSMTIGVHPGRDDLENLSLRGVLVDWVALMDAFDRIDAVGGQVRVALGDPPNTTRRVCPVDGDHRFVHDWGDPRGGRSHKGLDLVADRGTPLVAIEAGTVIQAGFHWAGGNGLYLRAAATGDVYYYAHLEAYAEGVETGSEVEPGEVLGTVGSSGNATIPHLHFGWMPKSGRVDLENLRDPYPLIIELCR